MSLDTFILVDPRTNQWFSAGSMYLVDTRKLSGEENEELLNYPPNEKTEKILDNYGMDLESCEYHKIMECAEQEETMTQQPQKAMTQQLSNATIIKLADALFSEALTYIETDEEYYETVVSVIHRFLIDRMGQMDDNLLNELSIQILEKINITPVNK